MNYSFFIHVDMSRSEEIEIGNPPETVHSWLLGPCQEGYSAIHS